LAIFGNHASGPVVVRAAELAGLESKQLLQLRGPDTHVGAHVPLESARTAGAEGQSQAVQRVLHRFGARLAFGNILYQCDHAAHGAVRSDVWNQPTVDIPRHAMAIAEQGLVPHGLSGKGVRDVRTDLAVGFRANDIRNVLPE